MENKTWDDVKVSRRRLEDQIRQDCSRLERLGVDPEEIVMTLESAMGFWWGELQDIEIPTN